MEKFSAKHRQISMPVAIALGVLASLIITLCGTILATSMMSAGKWEEGIHSIVSLITWILASFVGTLFSGVLRKDNNWLAELLTVLVYYLILLSVTIMFFDGEFLSIGKGILAVLAGFVPSFLICRPKSKPLRRKISYRQS